MTGGNEDFEMIKELIGAEEARKLAKAFAGSVLYIPKNIVTVELHRMIRQEYKAGATYRELKIRYGYSESHIRHIIHKKTHT